jgi:hypothetical protein
MELSQVCRGRALMVLVVASMLADAEAMAGATAVMRARSMLPSGRRNVRGFRRWPALTSCGSTLWLRESTPAVMPRMVCSGSPPDGSAAARAHTGPEVSWSARCAWLARSAAVARPPGQSFAEILALSVWISARAWLSWLRAITAVTASQSPARSSTPPAVTIAKPIRLRRRHFGSETPNPDCSVTMCVFNHVLR